MAKNWNDTDWTEGDELEASEWNTHVVDHNDLWDDVNTVDSDLSAHTAASSAHGSNGDVAGMDDLFSGSYTDLVDVPSEFNPSSHGDGKHTESYAKTDADNAFSTDQTINGDLFVNGETFAERSGPLIYSWSYSGGDRDTRLGNAITDASDGDVILLEDGEYLSDRTISKRVGLIGTSANAFTTAATRLSGAFTFTVAAWVRQADIAANMTFQGPGYITGCGLDGTATVTFEDPRSTAIGTQSDTTSSLGTLQFDSGSDGVTFEVANQADVTDNTGGSLTTLSSLVDQSTLDSHTNADQAHGSNGNVAGLNDLFSGSYDDLTDVPSAFTPTVHDNSAHSGDGYTAADTNETITGSWTFNEVLETGGMGIDGDRFAEKFTSNFVIGDVDGTARDLYFRANGNNYFRVFTNGNAELTFGDFDIAGGALTVDGGITAGGDNVPTADADRKIWVISNGASDPAGAENNDLIFEEES